MPHCGDPRDRPHTPPTIWIWQRDISISLERLGNIKSSTGDKQGALQAYEEMLSIDRRVAEADPSNLQREREVMFSLNKVGDMRFELSDMSGSLADYEEALGIARKLVENDGANPRSERDLALSFTSPSYSSLGGLAAFEERLALSRDLAERKDRRHRRGRSWRGSTPTAS